MHDQKSRANLSSKSFESLEHHAIYPQNYQQLTEVPLEKPPNLNKTFFKGPRLNTTKKFDTFFISAATLETTQTINKTQQLKPIDVPLSSMLK